MPFVLATPHHAPAEVVNQADSSHEGKNSALEELTEEQLEAYAGGQPPFLIATTKHPEVR